MKLVSLFTGRISVVEGEAWVEKKFSVPNMNNNR